MSKVFVHSRDTVGPAMAGPGIRSWELATALAVHHEVVLGVPHDVPAKRPDGFTVVSTSADGLRSLVSTADVVLSQSIDPVMLAAARAAGTRLVLDAYDPVLLELLEVYAARGDRFQRAANARLAAETRLSILAADGVICASEKQRDLWVGALLASDRIRPAAYSADQSLRQLVDVVPFGMQDSRPTRKGPGLRARFGLGEDDRVLLWGGGVWNWFDPLTLIRAVAAIAVSRDDVKLVFMGLKHPNEAVPEMEMARRAVALSDALGVRDSSVFFNFEWVSYDERQNYLLDADLGVTNHFDHLETRFSFRTRVLDYLWAGLPVVSTRGDSMSEFVVGRGVGRAVDYEDENGLVEALVGLLDDRPMYDGMRLKMTSVQDELTWSVVVQPLLRMIDGFAAVPPRRLALNEVLAAAAWTYDVVKQAAADGGLRNVIGKVRRRVIPSG